MLLLASSLNTLVYRNGPELSPIPTARAKLLASADNARCFTPAYADPRFARALIQQQRCHDGLEIDENQSDGSMRPGATSSQDVPPLAAVCSPPSWRLCTGVARREDRLTDSLFQNSLPLFSSHSTCKKNANFFLQSFQDLTSPRRATAQKRRWAALRTRYILLRSAKGADACR